VDIFAKLSRYEQFKTALQQAESIDDFDNEKNFREVQINLKTDFEDIFHQDGSGKYFTEEEFASVSEQNIDQRIKEIEAVGKTKTFLEMN